MPIFVGLNNSGLYIKKFIRTKDAVPDEIHSIVRAHGWQHRVKLPVPWDQLDTHMRSMLLAAAQTWRYGFHGPFIPVPVSGSGDPGAYMVVAENLKEQEAVIMVFPALGMLEVTRFLNSCTEIA